jgi:hypothetical protein
MIHPQRMHSKDNHEVSPDEKVSLATLVKMSKMLKLERGNHHFYPPQRLVIQNFSFPTDDNGDIDYIMNVPIKFIQLLHPTKTMVQAEYVNMDETNAQPFYFTISLPDIPSAKDWYVDYDSSTTVSKTEPSSIIWSGLSTKNDAIYYLYPAYNTPVNTNQVGFPITDTQYLNNNQINIRVKTRDFDLKLRGPKLDLTLVFYSYSGYED